MRGADIWCMAKPTTVLPVSTAEYAGRMYLNRWSRTDPNNSSRRELQSSLALTADFDNRTVSGLLDDWSARDYGGGRYEDLNNVEVMIQTGTIANAQFTAELAGRDGNFTGSMTGQFFGPGAAEVGGVIDGQTNDNVFEGWFGGKKQ